MLNFLLSSLLLLASQWALAFDHSHAAWDQLLKTYRTADGRLPYQRLKSDSEKDPQHGLPSYLASIQAVSEKEYIGWSDAQKKAFLINAYNALTVKLILDHYPVKSIKQIGGLFRKPWSVSFFKLLDGRIQKLDPIEHDFLRPHFKDYRIHAAVNCASLSCPPLRGEAYVAERLNAQLDEQMRAWLADPSRNQFGEHEIKLSKIFDWYQADFEKWGGGIHKVLENFAPAAAATALKNKAAISFLDYDWNLNDAP